MGLKLRSVALTDYMDDDRDCFFFSFNDHVGGKYGMYKLPDDCGFEIYYERKNGKGLPLRLELVEPKEAIKHLDLLPDFGSIECNGKMLSFKELFIQTYEHYKNDLA